MTQPCRAQYSCNRKISSCKYIASIQPYLGHKVDTFEAPAQMVGDEKVQQFASALARSCRQRNRASVLQSRKRSHHLGGQRDRELGALLASLAKGAAVLGVESRQRPRRPTTNGALIESRHEPGLGERLELERNQRAGARGLAIQKSQIAEQQFEQSRMGLAIPNQLPAQLQPVKGSGDQRQVLTNDEEAFFDVRAVQSEGLSMPLREADVHESKELQRSGKAPAAFASSRGECGQFAS